MYHDIREICWWDEMKKDIAEFVAQCLNCLPRTQRRFDSIWVVVDKLTKSAHFLPVKTTHSAEDYARLYIKEIIRLHGVPISIISDRGAQFTANFWRSFQKGFGTQSRSPIGWFEVGETKLVGPDLVQQAVEKIKLIRKRLLAAQSRQKSYVNNRRRDLEFWVDDWVFLKVSPMKGVMRFGKKGKLSPRYIGPYKIIRRVGQIIPIDDVQVTKQLSYEEAPIAILDRQVRRLRTKDVSSFKVGSGAITEETLPKFL
ncbi:PREDICTED: uncharacterized protein LOC109212750 [Nicotiana attenuata]|uniref:uncharacterized protein LOC109212750 n=1 Tax=Nicotiana attenuata TaxID=49451 RepID=UPI00090595D9|nr:PREDICTED: uncharacterized protein LOC109212750 [Nicotiana attenuata]